MYPRRIAFLSLAVLSFALAAGCLYAQTSPDSSHATPRTTWSIPLLLGAQINVIHQQLQPFHAAYDGPNSLTHSGDQETSEAYGVYLGSRLGLGFEAYIDAEMIRGNGIGRTVGLGGITNGDVIRQGSADLGDGPYVARAFLRWTHGFGAEKDTLARAPDQAATVVGTHRVEVTAGKLAVTDLLDVNRYANSTRLQFMNWGLISNTAWDYAADTRGYSNGIGLAWITPRWALRVASFQMPTRANGNVFDDDLANARGDNIELTLSPESGTVVRLLAYMNHARMGNYREAIARGVATGAIPDIIADDAPGRTKYGFGANVEQPLADSGETGLFLRAGWSDGHNESFVFTEVDREVSAGIQISGAHWWRREDRLALAFVHHALSEDHRDYLAAGGSGFLLGDGRLNYGDEQIGELYYRVQIGPFVEIGPDVQYVVNPGYNRDRGPALIASLRFNVRY